MRNIKLTIEYDGKDFNGWQKQPTKLNIQGTIEQAIKQITGEEVQLNASGRTDAGVHAFGQVANFKTNSQIPIEKFAIAINSKLKRSIVIKNAEEVDENGFAHITQRNKFTVGEMIEIMKPDGRNITATVRAIYDEDGNSVESAPHPQQKLAVDLGTEIEKYDLLRRAEA